MAQLRYNKSLLARLEDIFAESDYILRYEKGSFHSGYCLLNDTKIAIVNKYYPLEGKITCLIEILRKVDIEPSKLSSKNRELYRSLDQAVLEL